MQTTLVRQADVAIEPASRGRPRRAGAASGRARRSGRKPARSRESAFKSRSNGGANADRGLIEALGNSKIFQDYERAFTEATGLPVALRAVESWQLPHHGQRNESPFCALVLETSRACASCLQVQEKLSAAAAEEPRTVSCPTALCDTAVPVRLGDRLIGFLQTGQVFRKRPTEAQFQRMRQVGGGMGCERGPDEAEGGLFRYPDRAGQTA